MERGLCDERGVGCEPQFYLPPPTREESSQRRRLAQRNKQLRDGRVHCLPTSFRTLDLQVLMPETAQLSVTMINSLKPGLADFYPHVTENVLSHDGLVSGLPTCGLRISGD